MNINLRPKKCSGQSRYGRYGSYATVICEKTAEQTQGPPGPAKPQPGLDSAAPSYQPVPTTNITTICSDKREAVLLQTACTIIHNLSEPHISIEVRLLFDSGSQRSYITEQAKKLLRLEPTGEQLLTSATFGSSKGQRRVCEIVNVSGGLFTIVLVSVCCPHHM